MSKRIFFGKYTISFFFWIIGWKRTRFTVSLKLNIELFEMFKFEITFHFFSCSIDICESIVNSVHYFIKSYIFFLFVYYFYLRQVSWLFNTFHCHLSLLVDCLIEKKSEKEIKKKETLPQAYRCSYIFSFKAYTCSHVMLHRSNSVFLSTNARTYNDNNVHTFHDLQFSSL